MASAEATSIRMPTGVGRPATTRVLPVREKAICCPSARSICAKRDAMARAVWVRWGRRAEMLGVDYWRRSLIRLARAWRSMRREGGGGGSRLTSGKT